MKRLLLILAIISLLLVGCDTGVSQEEYNDVATQLESVRAEKQVLQEQLEQTQEEKEALQTRYDNVILALSDANDKIERLENELKGCTKPLIVHFIDVGQGDAILADLGETEILIDGGGKSPGVVDYLQNYVDGPIEVIVATHPHADHIGGLIEVLEQFEVNEVWHNGDESTSKTYAEFMDGVDAEGADVHIARLHDTIEAGELSLYVHHPAELVGSTNNNSIVLHLQYGKTDFLFTGDAEQEAEGQMMMLSSVQIPEVEVLKVGHHGSRTASSLDFLQITSPEVAIYMCKEGNSYGHPHEETITKLNSIGATTYGTDSFGTITVITDGTTYSVQTDNDGKVCESSSSGQSSSDGGSTSSSSTSDCSCSSDSYNCGDFSTRAQAQACYEYCLSTVGKDVHRLDGDNDGSACESLP